MYFSKCLQARVHKVRSSNPDWRSCLYKYLKYQIKAGFHFLLLYPEGVYRRKRKDKKGEGHVEVNAS